MSKEPKHHYIPVFYLKRWAANDGRLVEYSRQGKHNFVTVRWTSPTGTAYVRGLNIVPGGSAAASEFVEKKFMQLVDDWAARALAAFLANRNEPTDREKIGWARFLYSLIVRTPEHIERIRAKSPDYKITSPPQVFLPTLINSKRVIAHIAGMKWYAANFAGSGQHFLTSDRPIIMSNGLSSNDAHIALPISPTSIFIAVARVETFEEIKSRGADIVRLTNTRVAEQAIKYVYGVDDSQVYFLATRLGKKLPSTPLD
jgi:hypothetical protein